ncbi:MAG: hypothetical protein P1U56_08885 [Saprospiraceae bacterium]|nr:hypothetical protein [Saprospiraceae bacterium]
MSLAPRAFNRNIFSNREQVYYGTDDGSRDGSFGEFKAITEHYTNVSADRKEDIHMISVIGGLYGLNLIHLWKPKKITFFDINPLAIIYFNLILHVWTTSDSPEHFLERLTNGDYEATTEDEIFIKENIQIVQKTGTISADRGAFSSHDRDLENSWRLALENFDETKKYLLEAEITIRTEPMEGENFKEMIRSKSHHWIYASNITQFHFFELEILEPSNVVLLQIHHEDAQLLDLAEYAGKPVIVKFEYPIRVETK